MVNAALAGADEPLEPRPAGRRRLREEANFEALPDSIPPQNLEAEEAVLGAILLDPDAIGRVADVLQPEAFYLGAHREIYRTAVMLHSQGKPMAGRPATMIRSLRCRPWVMASRS